ncbi:MAG: tetratricopeptide repeat protein [Acidobacteriota bacterium]
MNSDRARRRMVSSAARALLVCASLSLFVATTAGQVPTSRPDLERGLQTFEQALAGDPENLRLAADYRKLTLEAGLFDRAIDVLRALAKRKGSGPNVAISLALAYADKVPTSGDIRRLYLGRDAMNALTQSIAQRPSVLAYYYRGQINLYYNRLIFHRTDKGVADLTRALSMVTAATPQALVTHVYTALGDGYYRLDQLAMARQVWSEGLARSPGDAGLGLRLEKDGQALLEIVTAALSAGRRSDTSLTGMLPVN